ncbi:hypothetical protein FRB94_009609 [Tulasnella sp. JGI-2019a]|nr:hypothetical protein FRB94_009609 [Tulasnella sp. JGI-2019a]KAG8996836.1 hypothetical protein FRB93_000648 [Tulasnella sp. JGI-2019a]KAG9034997.1 hypothetical protein FRB95_012287 [Tulasnella sp. JGI-2019a]
MAPMYEAEFIWTEPAGSVILTGTFDNWSQSIRLAKGEAGFIGKVQIPYGQKTDYKFVVDGRWTVNYNFPTEWDQAGNMNNYIMAPAEPPPSVLALDTAAKAAAGSAATVPEPVTPINRPVDVTTSVTPLAVPESAIAPHPGLMFDSSMARSIVESFVEVVNPAAPKPTELKTDKVNEPASPFKDLADTTAPSAAVAAVQHTVGPYIAAVQEKATSGITAINGSMSPLLNAPHTSEIAPVSAGEKQAEPGYPIRDLASLTGPAPIVAAAQDKVAQGVTAVKGGITPLLNGTSNTAIATGEDLPANGEQKLSEPGYPIRALASGPAQVLASAQGTISPAMASVNDAVSPVIASAQEKVAPAVAYAQGKAAPVLAALQGAVHTAVATVTETPAAAPKDTLAPPSKPVAEAPAAPKTGKEELVHGNGTTGAAKPDENPIHDAANLPEPLAVPTEPATVAPIDLAPSPVEVAPVASLVRPSTPPPTEKSAVPAPTTPHHEKNGTVGPSSTFSNTTSSTTTTPVKPNNKKRTSSLGAKFFPRSPKPGSPDAAGGNDNEGTNSPSRASVKRAESGSTRNKRRSIIEKIKDVFHHHDHPAGSNGAASK